MRETSKFNLYSLNDCRSSFCIRDDYKVCHGCNVELPDNDYYFFKKNNRDNGSTKCKKCRGFDYGVDRPNKVYKDTLPKGYKICCQCNKMISDEEYSKYNKCEDCSRKKRKIYHQRDDVKKSKLKFAKKRRSLKNNTVHDLTTDEYAETLIYFNNSCAYCGISNEECLDKTGKSLEQEHIIPISKKGGYTKNNIIPACKSCNNSKSNKDLGDFISRRIHKKKINFKNVCLIYYFINSNGLKNKF
jgi:5-methylcytosine-specific restriction endonuclease McrA